MVFGFGKKKRPPIMDDDFGEEKEQIDPKDIVPTEDFPEEEEQDQEEEQEEEEPEEILPKPVLKKSLVKPKQKPQRKVEVENESITEEDIINSLETLSSQLNAVASNVNNLNDLIPSLLQKVNILEERARSTESTLFRMRNS